ncbi:hypothetical protein EVAR_101181_1 [Eumeta japonica]|uniref:Uncharacterized protein n=1 Tax=Eumeta variegata TaxID=151549 RepID=A0A4C1SNF2_EUMVA|nr:hypothetical protein EVAR_101181_1 [Eumeta japonica]
MELEGGHRNSVIKRRNPIEFGLVRLDENFDTIWIIPYNPSASTQMIEFLMSRRPESKLCATIRNKCGVRVSPASRILHNLLFCQVVPSYIPSVGLHPHLDAFVKL